MSGEEHHKISVCMASFNGERFIAQQISSILCQLGCNDELIVSDDGSTDTTCTILKSLNDSRIHLLHNPHPGSPARNFEYALQHAQGEYVFLADQDDVWFRHKVEVVIRLLQTSEVVVTDCTMIDSDGRQLTPSFFQHHNSRSGFLSNLIKNSYLGCCMAFRRSFLNKVLPIPPHAAMHDIWFGILAEWYGCSCFHPEPLMAYRRHDAALSTTGFPSNFSFRQKIRFRYHLMVCLMRRIAELRVVS